MTLSFNLTEKDHIQEVFSDGSCTINSTDMECLDSNLYFYASSNGRVYCRDRSDGSYCQVIADGTVDCGKVKVDGIENVGFQTNTAKTVFANSSGLCLTRKKKTSCFKKGNWATEKEHIQQVFSDVGTYNGSTGLGCYVDSSTVNCTASDFSCDVRSNGYVFCRDRSGGSDCYVNSDGSLNCT